MKIGAWIHSADGLLLDDQIKLAADNGLETIRCYTLSYAETAAPALKRTGMSLLGGMHVEAAGLVEDWRSQCHLDDLARYHELEVPLEAICVGNELREGGDAPGKKRFTARLSFGLANVLDTYRQWLDKNGFSTPLTYAMEGIVFDDQDRFHEWVWPLIDVCDVVAINHYPMGNSAWFGFEAFEESQRFLKDGRVRNGRLAAFEMRLRVALDQLWRTDKPLVLSETGFPSAVAYQLEEGRLVVPKNDNAHYGALMVEFVKLVRRVNTDYQGRIGAIYFYEWRDNLFHSKIWNVEQSPIHTAFGLCDRFGTPKFDIRMLTGHSP